MERNIIIKGGSIVLTSLIFKFLIDYPTSLFILDSCGYILSVLIMSLINLSICFIFLKIYDSKRIDLLGAEISKKNKLLEKGEEIVGKLTQLKKFSFFLLLSIKIPTWVVVVYSRQGSYLYNGFSDRKIKVFTILSTLLLSIIWNMILLSGFSLWDYLKGN